MAGGSGNRDEDRLGSTAKALAQAQPYIDATWQLIGAVAVGTLGGYFLDRWLGTDPWLMLGGALFGVVGGMISFFKAIARLEAKRPRAKFDIRPPDDRRDAADRPDAGWRKDDPEKK